jgi:DNA polymerase-1
MSVPDPTTLDFETLGITDNPTVKPPLPVGCAVHVPGAEPFYLGWQSEHGDANCSFEFARSYLRGLVAKGSPLLFHHAAFDISVMREHLGIRIDDWRRVHDTMYHLFLADPYSTTLALKPCADRYLGMAPNEKDALYAWIVSHVPGATPKTSGAYISHAPVALVAPHAIGDVVRTRRLFDLLHAQNVNDGMEDAYDRERRGLPIFMDATRRGIRLDRDRLSQDVVRYNAAEAECRARIAEILGDDCFDSDDAYADALERVGAVESFVLTPKSGKRSVSKENLRIVQPELKSLIEYMGYLGTCLQTFMRPWLVKSEVDGRLHPNWNQVRQSRDVKNVGAKTGRLSSDDPNFQNVPAEFLDKEGNAIPSPSGLLALPRLRSYLLPNEGHVWLKRDFSSQEIRVLAHFEDGELCESYRRDPGFDPHAMARTRIHEMTGRLYARKKIKTVSFAILYGAGAPGIARQLGCSLTEAAEIKAAYLAAMPGIGELIYHVQKRGKRGEAVRTWGGRRYVAETPQIVAGRLRDFAYKLTNYLVQGSAADQTKQAINDWYDAKYGDAQFLATVHDEINISVPAEEVDEHMRVLRCEMDRDRLDVPMSSEGEVGINWGTMRKYRDVIDAAA